MSSRQAAESRYERRVEFSVTGRRLPCKAFGEFNEGTAVAGILDFPEGDDKPQPFDNIQVDFIVAKQLQQLVPGVIGIVDVHRRCSGRR